jgi:hypothetical protein
METTKPTIEDMNKVIAEFMGLKYDPAKTDAHKFYVEKEKDGWKSKTYCNPLYNSSWDSLKPVIDEIFTYALAHPGKVKKIAGMSIVVDIRAAHEAVYEFITWHTSQP